MTRTPLLRWTGLWERTSARGTRYFSGRIAGLKVVILPNPDSSAGPDEPTHTLFVAPPTERPAEAQPPSIRPTRRVRNAYRHLMPIRDARLSGDGRPFDDELPELHDDGENNARHTED